MRKYKLKPVKREVSLDLSTKDIQGAKPKQFSVASLSRNILTTDDIFGAQADTIKLPNVTKNRNKGKDTFNRNPLFGGPKYGNIQLQRYEEDMQRSSSLNSKSSLKSIQEVLIPAVYSNSDKRQESKRYFLNRYTNKSNMCFDWKENIEQNGYKHPLGNNHTSLDLYLREEPSLNIFRLSKNLSDERRYSQNQSQPSIEIERHEKRRKKIKFNIESSKKQKIDLSTINNIPLPEIDFTYL